MLAPRFMQGLLHRRKQVLQHGAGAKLDFGADLHAGRQAMALFLSLQERRYWQSKAVQQRIRLTC